MLRKITRNHVTYDEDSRSGSGSEASQRKVAGTLHWVSLALKCVCMIVCLLMKHQTAIKKNFPWIYE
jgi:hypothetical protein